MIVFMIQSILGDSEEITFFSSACKPNFLYLSRAMLCSAPLWSCFVRLEATWSAVLKSCHINVLLWLQHGCIYGVFTSSNHQMNFFSVKNLNCRKIGPNSMQTPKSKPPPHFSGYAPGLQSCSFCMDLLNWAIFLVFINKLRVIYR